MNEVKGLVFIDKSNNLFTDSLMIAEEFEKRHDDVLKDIRNQIQKLFESGESEWGIRNFAETQYQHPQNKQWYPKYDMTEDAFALVVMSYITPKAMKAKVRFINEFKRMREYIQNQLHPKLPRTYKEALLALVQAEEEKEKLQTEKLMLEQVVAESKPKLTYLDKILSAKNAILMKQIADDYGYTAQKMNRLLHDFGIQYKINGQWLLYEKYKGEGYTKSETHYYTDGKGNEQVRLHTKWTQKGRLFLYEFLKKHDILPLMDTVESDFIDDWKEYN